jgi:predicted enzyme related to lactoylglutathione lyase
MVTGIGGIFIKSNDPKFLSRLYEDNLGISFGTKVYFSFKWRENNAPENICFTDLSFFEEDTSYFYPGTNDVMLNLRVNNLDDLRIRLKNDGVFVIDKIESYDYGRFGWAMDPIGNKIELWEPVDRAFPNPERPIDLTNVTGLGGIFLKCPDPELLMKWYSKQFDLFFNYSSHTFTWKDFSDKKITGQTVLSFFPDESAYFNPSNKNYMLNFRVADLNYLLTKLKSNGVEVSDKAQEYEYGKFGWLMDPEGNKIELWEPVDEKLGS